MDPAALEAEIRAFLCDELGLDFRNAARDDELLSRGLCDSSDLARLATFLEERLAVTIPDRDLNAHYFDSLAKIVAYLEGRIAGSAG